ncbi:MAG: CPBP family intramembrane metalloprotease [Defluviitaleaceae bacterium]|nr:CPBP family intramembrane metalloprotease [Defluviitaleaceae bacterium]
MKKHLTGSKFMLFLTLWVVLSQLTITGVLLALDAADIVNINIISTSPWYMVGMQLVILMLPLMVWLIMKEDKLAPNIPRQQLSAKNIILVVAISLLIQPAMMTLSGISSLFFTNYISEMIYTFMEHPLWLILLATAVTPAVCEELVFRGYLQTQHKGRKLKQVAILNGLFFAIIHLNLQQFAYAFVMGIIFVYMVHYTRSIWAGILSHFIVNATQGIMGRWAFAATDTHAQVQTTERLIPAVSPEVETIILIGGFALLLAPVIVLLFREFFRYNKSKMAEEAEIAALTQATIEDIVELTELTETSNPMEEDQPVPSLIDKYVIIVILIYALFQGLLFLGRAVG